MVQINGLAELAETLPDDSWHCLRVFIRRVASGCEVAVAKEVKPVTEQTVIRATKEKR